MDLFAIATTNTAALETRLNECLEKLEQSSVLAVQGFAQWVEEHARVAINVRIPVLVELLEGRPHRNIYEWAEDMARLSGKTTDELLRERLGPFYDRRLAFDDSFKLGRRFRYGALNGGGAGLDSYGAWCVVLAGQEFQQAACWQGDSLDSDAQSIAGRAVAYSHRHRLVAAEQSERAATSDSGLWPMLLLDGKEYFEVVFVEPVTLATIGAVRVAHGTYRTLWDLAFNAFGTKQSEAERALVSDFVCVLKAEQQGRIHLEVLR